MSDHDPLLQSAIQLHRAGRIDEARALYQQIVDANPMGVDALHLLGMSLRQLGRHAEAIAHLRRAVAIDASQAPLFGNLAEAHRELGQTAEAIECYAAAARLAPQGAEVHSNLGALLQQVGRLDEAEASYAHALRCDPRFPDAHYNLGNLFQVRRQWDRAIACYRQALEIKPDYGAAQCNLGNALRERGEVDEALRWLETATALDPDSVAAISNLGVVLQDLGRPQEAQPHCERALKLAPNLPQLHTNLGTVYKDLGDLKTAIECYDRALAIQGDHAQALLSRSTAILALGDLEAGFAGYEHRIRCEQFDTRNFPQPRWDGSPLEGRTLLVHSEQGLGDTLQFIRYVRLATQPGGTVLVSVQPVLLPLLRASGIPNLLPAAEPLPPFDVHVPLMSLPYVFHTREETIVRDVPYLAVEPQRVERWREYLQEYPGLKVGIVWQGRPDHRRDRVRSIPLAAFAPLARVPGVRLFSLQKGPGCEQLAALLAGQGGQHYFDLVDTGSKLDNDGPMFMDTAAVIKNLDLVIAADTGLAHLAGGLAAPTWVALCVGAEWRWMIDREDSPWYPSMRLFRQPKLGDWTDVFRRMADALREQAEGRRL